MSHNPILIIGASGKVGRRVVANLTADGHLVRPAGRHTPLPFDWQDRSNWAEHFTGVETAYVSYYPDLAAPGADEDITALVAVAKAAGLKRMVLLSGRGESGAERCESILAASGLGYTLLRASWFNQNFSEGMLQPGVMAGLVALPAAMRLEPFVDVDDIAEVATSALLDDRHNNQLYELTGPRLMTFADAASEISAASGLEVAYAPISPEEFHAGLRAEAGQEVADLLVALCQEVFDGRNESLSDGVMRALDRPPRDFADFCRSATLDGAWKKAA